MTILSKRYDLYGCTLCSFWDITRHGNGSTNSLGFLGKKIWKTFTTIHTLLEKYIFNKHHRPFFISIYKIDPSHKRQKILFSMYLLCLQWGGHLL